MRLMLRALARALTLAWLRVVVWRTVLLLEDVDADIARTRRRRDVHTAALNELKAEKSELVSQLVSARGLIDDLTGGDETQPAPPGELDPHGAACTTPPSPLPS